MEDFNKGIYLNIEVRYKLRELACKYHITLKKLIPTLLLYAINNMDSVCYHNLPILKGKRRLAHITISDVVYDRLKMQACKSQMRLNDFINAIIMATINYYDIPNIIVSYNVGVM